MSTQGLEVIGSYSALSDIPNPSESLVKTRSRFHFCKLLEFLERGVT